LLGTPAAGPTGAPADPPTLGLPTLPTAKPDAIQAGLGRKLFFDRRLSFNGTMSCAMCHVPEEGFASNASKLAVGIEGRNLKRNAPTLLNVAWQTSLFHDGREPSLDVQAWSPLLHADEMANPSVGHLLARVQSLPDYAGRFEQAFGGTGASMQTLAGALAAYQRTLIAAGSRFDRWRHAGDATALSALEQRGFAVFTAGGRCSACHSVGERDALFSDMRFHVTGIGTDASAAATWRVPLAAGVQTTLTRADLAALPDAAPADLGRFEVTQDPADLHAFKTPSLRNVAQTGPYLHNGSLATLEAVIDAYDRGGAELAGKSPLIKPLRLSQDDKRALAAFLRALDSPHLGALVAQARREAPPR
jgi:cytochrome c peroxidase